MQRPRDLLHWFAILGPLGRPMKHANSSRCSPARRPLGRSRHRRSSRGARSSRSRESNSSALI